MDGYGPGFAGSLLSAGLVAPNNVVLVPVVPLPNIEDVEVVPLVEGGGFPVFPKMLPPGPNGEGVGVDCFALKRLPEVVPGAGAFEIAPPPNVPPVAVVVVVVPGAGVVEVVLKSELAGLVLKMFAGATVVVPVPVVPVPVVPDPVAGVVESVRPKSPEPAPKTLGVVPPPPPVPRSTRQIAQLVRG